MVTAEMPGTNVLLGSFATQEVTPDIAALIVYTIKFFLLTLTTNTLSIAMSLVKDHYKVLDANCFHVTGLSTLSSTLITPLTLPNF